MYTDDYGFLNPDDYNLTIVGLAGTPTGSANTTVLAFNAAASTTGNIAIVDWCTVVNSATDGSSFKIRRPGLYLCVLGISMPEESVAWPGITVDAPSQILVQNPAVVTNPAAVLAGAGVITTITGQTAVEHVTAVVPVSQLDASGADGVIRFQCSDGANGAVAAASLDLAQCFARIQRIGDLRSRA